MKKITISDQQIFNKYIEKCDYEHNFNFTYFIMWDNRYDFYYKEIKNQGLIIYSKTFNYFLNPITSEKNFLNFWQLMHELSHDMNIKFKIHNVLESFMSALEKVDLSQYSVCESRNTFDYVYDAQKIKNYQGKKLQKKRNHVNNFLKNYVPVIESLSTIDNEQIEQFLKIWSEQKEHNKYLEQELNSIKNIVNLKDSLNIRGIVIKIEGQLVAITFGTPINQNTFMIHVEKALTDYNGLYPFTRQALVREKFGDFNYANAEEDIGDEGLRKSKLSYRPDHFLKKYQIYQK